MAFGTWKKIVDKAFPGNRGILHGRPHVIVVSDPANNVPAACPVGSLILNSANANQVYICTVANTTLVKITNA